MNKKIGFVLALVVISLMMVSTVSAGLFDFMGGDNANATANDENTFIVGFDAELDSGSIDCIWNGFTINGRENDYTWSEPYIDNKQVVVVKSDSGIKSLEDLAGKTVETQKDSSALAALQGDNKTLADTFGTLTEVADYNTAFMDLESGACDAVAIDIGVAQYQVSSKDNPDDYSILNDSISSEQYGIGFKKGNDALKDQVQETLNAMFEDGTVAKIAENYTDSGVPGSLITK